VILSVALIKYVSSISRATVCTGFVEAIIAHFRDNVFFSITTEEFRETQENHGA
jgi:hypothetical protein